MGLGKFFRVRKSYLILLVLAVAGYFGQDAYFNWKVMSSLPTLPARERFAYPYLANPVPKSVTANGVTYEISPRRIEWVPVVYVEKNHRRFEDHVAAVLRDMDEAGSSELTGTYSALAEGGEKDDTLMETVLDAWCESSPESHVPWLVRGRYRRNRAWRLRGRGTADTVGDEAWAGFREGLLAAREDLERSYALEPRDPNSSAFLVDVATGLGLPREEMERHYRNAISAYPWHLGARSNKLWYLAPWWHGSEEEMLGFAEEAAALGEQHPYLSLLSFDVLKWLDERGPSDRRRLAQPQVWHGVVQAFERFFERNPENLRHRFAYADTAIVARKYDTAVRQLELIGNRWEHGTPMGSLEEFNASRAKAYMMLGWEMISRKMYDPAVGFLETANSLDRTYRSSYLLGVAYHNIGMRLRSMLDIRKAQLEYRRSLALKPDFKDARTELVKLTKRAR